MANILDYIDWRGDLSFQDSPFCSIDALILSEFAYLPLEGIISEGQEVTVADAFKAYSPENIPENKRIISFQEDNLLFAKMAVAERFKDILVSRYVNFIDSEAEIQFSAMILDLGDGRAFAAFRGTDNTVIGWKEDMALSYLQYTPGQQCAVQYLNSCFYDLSREIIIGGHSKGGNLAVFAAAFCEEPLRERISAVYAFDAPGFSEEIAASKEYSAVLSKVHSFVPESSVVGMLLASSAENTIVRSSSVGIMQHLAYSWEVLRTDFVRSDGLSKSGSFVSRTLSNWLGELSDEDKRNFVDTIFQVIEASDKQTISEINSNKLATYPTVFKAFRGLSEQQQTSFKETLKKLAQSGRNAIRKDT